MRETLAPAPRVSSASRVAESWFQRTALSLKPKKRSVWPGADGVAGAAGRGAAAGVVGGAGGATGAVWDAGARCGLGFAFVCALARDRAQSFARARGRCRACAFAAAVRAAGRTALHVAADAVAGRTAAPSANRTARAVGRRADISRLSAAPRPPLIAARRRPTSVRGDVPLRPRRTVARRPAFGAGCSVARMAAAGALGILIVCGA